MEKKIILKNERTYNSDDVKLASKENIKERFLLFFTIYSAFLILLGGVFIIIPNNIAILKKKTLQWPIILGKI